MGENTVDEWQVEVEIAAAGDSLSIPRYMTSGAAGMDLEAAIDEEITIAPGARALVGTGIIIALPTGFEAQVRPRSGLAVRTGLTVLNSPGTIDSDYRGEIKVLLVNLGEKSVAIGPGHRIAQLVVAPVSRVRWKIVEGLPSATTDRGSGGFGHTGRKGADDL